MCVEKSSLGKWALIVSAIATVSGCGGGGGDDGPGPVEAGWAVDSDELRFDATMGVRSEAQEFTIRNRGSQALSFTVATDEPWILVGPVSGTIEGDGRADISVEVECPEPEEHSGEITVAGAGARETIDVHLTCEVAPTEIDVLERPEAARGGPQDPPTTTLAFRLESDWMLNRSDVRFEISAEPRVVSVDPADGKAEIGERVDVEVALNRCDETGDLDIDILIEAEYVDEPERVTWIADCHAGNPSFLAIETYQGPRVVAYDVEKRADIKNRGTEVSPVEGRAAVVAVRFSHFLPEIPEIEARLVERTNDDFRRISGGKLNRAIPDRIDLYPDDYTMDRFETEAVFRIPPSRYYPQYAIELTMDPDNDLPEANEADNRMFHRFPIEMETFAPLRAHVIGFLRKPAEGESLAPDEMTNGRVDPFLAPPERYFERITDFWPVAWEDVPDRFILPSIEQRAGGEFFDWIQALEELERHRVVYAESLTDHYIGIVRRDGMICGAAYIDGYSSLSAELQDTSCGQRVIAHELGHNLGLMHANGNCGSENHNPKYPYPDAGMGPNRGWWFSQNRFVVGMDTDDAGMLVPPAEGEEHLDVMSYCDPVFISDYNYNRVLKRRVAGEPVALVSKAATGRGAPTSLALFGASAPMATPLSSGRLIPNSPDSLRQRRRKGNSN